MTIPSDLPVVPPFMRTCPRCIELLASVVETLVKAIMDWCDDGEVRLQFALSRHLAEAHPDDLPKPHTDGCETCAHAQQSGSDDVFWREHLARGLFLPDEIARLM